MYNQRMRLEDFPQPPSVYRDEVVQMNGFVIVKLAVLVNAENYFQQLVKDCNVLWWAEIMCAKLNESNLNGTPIVYIQPQPDPEPSFSHRQGALVSKQYPNPKYSKGEYVIGRTKTKPGRLPNHITPAHGTYSHSSGYVSVTQMESGYYMSKYWPENCLTPDSESVCSYLVYRNSIPLNLMVRENVPVDLMLQVVEWNEPLNHPENYSEQFRLP